MQRNPKAIANELLEIAKGEGEPVTPMKLQKLMYYAYGWWFVSNEDPLFSEKIQAWKNGPVVESVYYAFKEYGGAPITGLAHETANGQKRVAFLNDDHANEIRRFLGVIWNVYGSFSAVRLSNATHQPGTPWHTTVQNCGGKLGYFQEIDDATIRDYFVRQAKEKE